MGIHTTYAYAWAATVEHADGWANFTGQLTYNVSKNTQSVEKDAINTAQRYARGKNLKGCKVTQISTKLMADLQIR